MNNPLPTAYRYGWGCFETLRVDFGKACDLEEHLDRLFAGLLFCRIERPNRDLLVAQVKSKCQDFAQEFPRQNGLLRIQVFANLEPVLEISELEPRQFSPLQVLLLEAFPLASKNPLQQYKTCNYLLYQLAYLEAQAANFDEALLLNEQGEIQELSRSNLFFQDTSGIWFTPALGAGLLPGITRARLVLELGAQEVTLKLEDLKGFKRAFACNSLTERRPIQSIEVRGLNISQPLVYFFED